MKKVIATLTELSAEGVLLRQLENKMVAIFLVSGEVLAVEDLCPHRAGPLSEGCRRGTTITCPWHGSEFDLKTGKVLKGPAMRPLKTVAVRCEGGEIWADPLAAVT